MGSGQENWDSEWTGLDPKQPRSKRWGCGFGLVLLIILLLVICGASGYLAWQQFDLNLGPGLVLVPPTALSTEPDTTEAETPQPPATDLPSLAPTVTLSAAQTTASVEAERTAVTPLIDGNLDEWMGFPSFESRHLVYSVNGWDGTDDVIAKWRLGWDNENLFVAVQVEDDMHVQMESGNQIFKGDGISLQIDSDLEGDFAAQLSPDDYQVNLSPGDFSSTAPSAFRFRGTSNGGTADAPGHGIVVAALQTSQGYDLEATIPWQDIGLVPAAGLIIGTALNVNDNDTPGTAVQEVMKSHVETRAFRDPTSWGRLVLEENN